MRNLAKVTRLLRNRGRNETWVCLALELPTLCCAPESFHHLVLLKTKWNEMLNPKFKGDGKEINCGGFPFRLSSTVSHSWIYVYCNCVCNFPLECVLDDLVKFQREFTGRFPPVSSDEGEGRCGCDAWFVYMKMIECIHATVFMFKSMMAQLLALGHLVLLLALWRHTWFKLPPAMCFPHLSHVSMSFSRHSSKMLKYLSPWTTLPFPSPWA